MDIEHYEDHLMELEHVLEEALRRVAQRYPAHEDDLYIVGLEVDGQYHKVTVGVSNLRDETVTVDSTRLAGGGGLASRRAPRMRKFAVRMNYPELEIAARDEDEACEKYLDAYESDDQAGAVVAVEIVDTTRGLASHDSPFPSEIMGPERRLAGPHNAGR